MSCMGRLHVTSHARMTRDTSPLQHHIDIHTCAITEWKRGLRTCITRLLTTNEKCILYCPPPQVSAKCFPQRILPVCHILVITPPVLLGAGRELQVASLWLQKAPEPGWVLRLCPYSWVSAGLQDVCSHTHLHVQIGLLGGCWLLLLPFLLCRCFCLHCKDN